MGEILDNNNCCCAPDHQTGCMVCGDPLYCTADMPLRAVCFYCGREEETSVFCLGGHYVCDNCHSKDILELAENVCLTCGYKDPVEILLAIFELPGLHMHGPEYHSFVPAALVAAYGNASDRLDKKAVSEAIRRGKAVFGGICGSHGACGAAIGVGIAYSVLHGVTPYSTQERGAANKMTSLALAEISNFGGPRCCKRDSMLAVETAKRQLGVYEDTGAKYVCSQFPDNDMCLKTGCPYFPTNQNKV